MKIENIYKKLNRKLPASSIVESITAMLIILISFGAGMSIYLNVMSNERLLSKTKTNVLLSNLLEKSIQQHQYIDEVIQVEGLIVEKKIKPHPGYPQHHQLVLQAFDRDNYLIHEVREVIYLPEETPEKIE